MKVKSSRKRKTVSEKEVSKIAMVAGNERRIGKCICDGNLKEWVGIGWIDLGTASPRDYYHYPEVKGLPQLSRIQMTTIK